MSERLVVGLDLHSGDEVHCTPANVDELRARGQKGDQSLVCALCYAGDGSQPGHRVPLVVRAREGGVLRPHLAHPPGTAPRGGHSYESIWHLTAKHVIADGARRLPNVAEVAIEQTTADRKRRADVSVRLRTGTRIAIELQASPLTDRAWTDRHRDYCAQGIRDVWLWHPATAIHWIASKHGLPLWQFDPTERQLTALAGTGHDRPDEWWETDDLSTFAVHSPPCTGDRLQSFDLPLENAQLTQAGIRPPDELTTAANEALELIKREASKHRHPSRQSKPEPDSTRAARSRVDYQRDRSPLSTPGPGMTVVSQSNTQSQGPAATAEPTQHASPRDFHCVQCFLRARISEQD